MENTTAILMRKTRFSDTSLILTWFTAAFGKVKTIAKGALRQKSHLAADLFFRCEIQFARSAKSEIHTLREALVINARPNLPRDYRRVTAASYFVELLELATETDHPAPELFDLLERALKYLDDQPATTKAVIHFEHELVRLLGIANPGSSAIVALGKVYHKIPSSRAPLIQLLER